MGRPNGGFLYVFSNPSMEGIVKVGFSQRIPEKRILDPDLNSTGVPTPFFVEYYSFFENVFGAEVDAHKSLSDVQVGKEFFRCSVSHAISCIENVGGGIPLFRSQRVDLGEQAYRASNESDEFSSDQGRLVEALISKGFSDEEAEQYVNTRFLREPAPSEVLPLRGIDPAKISTAKNLNCELTGNESFLIIFAERAISQDLLFLTSSNVCESLSGKLGQFAEVKKVLFFRYCHDYDLLIKMFQERMGKLFVEGYSRGALKPKTIRNANHILYQADLLISEIRDKHNPNRSQRARYSNLYSCSILDIRAQ